MAALIEDGHQCTCRVANSRLKQRLIRDLLLIRGQVHLLDGHFLAGGDVDLPGGNIEVNTEANGKPSQRGARNNNKK